MQRTRRSVHERREELVDATLAILATEGLSAATTRRITDEADMALGAFHYAFRSKDELLRAVIERMANQIDAALRAAVAADGANLTSALEAIVQAYWDYVEGTPHVQLAQFELTIHALRDPELKPLAAWHYERLAATVSSVIESVPGAPDDAEREALARYLLATMDGLILHHCVQDDLDSARRRLQRHLATLHAAPWAASPRPV
ncbi:TetR/AcrR family transcriptional regulator [Egicoccus halophilus]|uniref:TetR/AcrR family transcriptional regulator n=1 Tax=Egicoccus halophilus TaxID=1670830 RepID=UPI001E61CF2B|nr:TetR/AcrR family transcriptional regulator [Egicoccus halophilus]